ncbi:Nucleotide-binding universal stress protein, UspA family [Dehalogenimonas formicexedens]|uniref:Nucleotide-binding universal stress protein, UspA family n=1 Tax=Dehalogenimonas formicexedens TaxID=1839801 RepID=A0A1P8F4N7_9CHLR|nr:universal stress protein [Dehalogenimonas formicexedens]APV43439.1 Nucleotide-binding universal stress protein, UspA family [Dehalogenimonas formicexedens]
MNKFHTILVPVAGRPEDEDALEMACQLARLSGDVKVIVTNIISIDRSLPLDAEVESEIAKSEAILARFENLAKKFGYPIETNLLQARLVAPAIVDEAVEQKADAIVIGSAYKTRFGEFSLGDVVPYILQHAPCRVILNHRPASL